MRWENFLCVLASIVITCIILLYPWGVTVLKVDDPFSVWVFSGKYSGRACGNGVMKRNGTIGMKQVFVTHGRHAHERHYFVYIISMVVAR